MADVLDELKKLVDVWQKQKDNELKDARICDAYIKAFSAAIQLVEQGQKKTTKSKPEGT